MSEQTQARRISKYSISTSDINDFLAAHPITADNPIPKTHLATGELHALDSDERTKAESLALLARDCNAVLRADADPSLKQAAFDAKVETIVRLQNPELATEECIVFEKAAELHDEFHDEQAKMYRYGEATLDQLRDMEDPADMLRHDFSEHIEQAYDLPAMRGRAQATLRPLIDDWYKDEFDRLVGYERADDPVRVAAFGRSVTARVVAI